MTVATRGSMTLAIDTPTIDELTEGPGEFESPEDLSLRVRWFPFSGESRRDLLEATLETSEDWSEPSVRWRASITADSTLRSQFEVCVDRVREIFARASQASWAQEHPRLHSLICDSWSTIGVGLTAGLWGVLFLILRDGAPALFVALLFGISLGTISGPFRRRSDPASVRARACATSPSSQRILTAPNPLLEVDLLALLPRPRLEARGRDEAGR